MNQNDKFHQNEQNASHEINDEALGSVAGGSNSPRPIICSYCGNGDSFGYRNGMLYCTKCNKNYVNIR